jgi:hypothetical protein
MSTGDFEAQVRQSVADHLALIATAATAAKGRIVKSVELLQAPLPAPAAVSFDEVASPSTPRPAVNFSAEEPAFAEESAFSDDFSVSADDDGIPVWEDAP